MVVPESTENRNRVWGLFFGVRLLKVSWKQNNFKLLKNYPFYFLFIVNMVIVVVPISWTTDLFLQYFLFGKTYAFQRLPCGSHRIILIPLLGPALLAAFLKVPLDSQSQIGTPGKHTRNRACFRRPSLPGQCQNPKAYVFVPCHCHRYFIFLPQFSLHSNKLSYCFISVVRV